MARYRKNSRQPSTIQALAHGTVTAHRNSIVESLNDHSIREAVFFKLSEISRSKAKFHDRGEGGSIFLGQMPGNRLFQGHFRQNPG